MEPTNTLGQTPAESTPEKQRRTVTHHARRVAIFVAGIAVTAAGFAMLVLPGPGLLVIIAGLSILAIEFAWAARLRDQARDRAKAAAASASRAVGRKKK
jgi:uncharacterized protein (TIGR02611 family)